MRQIWRGPFLRYLIRLFLCLNVHEYCRWCCKRAIYSIAILLQDRITVLGIVRTLYIYQFVEEWKEQTASKFHLPEMEPSSVVVPFFLLGWGLDNRSFPSEILVARFIITAERCSDRLNLTAPHDNPVAFICSLLSPLILLRHVSRWKADLLDENSLSRDYRSECVIEY